MTLERDVVALGPAVPGRRFRDQLSAAIRAVDVTGDGSFAWLGRPAWAPGRTRGSDVAPARRLAAALQRRLYLNFYLHGAPVPLEAEPSFGPEDPAPGPFARRLAAAHAGAVSLASAKLVRLGRSGAVVRVLGLHLHVASDAVVQAGNGALRAGSRVHLRLPAGFPRLDPGFHTFAGEAGLVPGESASLVRTYWNLRPEGAAAFAASVAAGLNRARVPFRAKILDRESSFTRCDAAVLFVRRADYPRAAAVLDGEIHPAVAAHLKPAVPAFTKPLAPGVGLAEDPGHGASFGEHRCRLVAEGILAAESEGGSTASERLSVVERRFHAEGVDPRRPFLDPHSRDVYGFRPRRPAAGSAVRRRAGDEATAGASLAAARAIGRFLTRDAIVHGGRCSWLSAADTGDRRRPGVRAVGGDLYEGTAGIGLFLAELHRVDSDAGAGRTAAAALRHALTAAVSNGSSERGLYAGPLGVAVAAARAGVLLGREELTTGARDVVRRWRRLPIGPLQNDLTSGRAGAIVALILLAEALDDPGLLDVAADLAEDLGRAARMTDGAISWPAALRPAHPDLVGFAHGTTGVAFALLELGHRTGAETCLTLARRAFEYDRLRFDPAARDWPDLRYAPLRASGRPPGPAFASGWCHGAPGIALSRSRAYRLLRDERLRREAGDAVAATRRAVEAALHAETGGFDLCHGLAGRADALLECGRVLDGSAASTAATEHLVERVARFCIARRAQRWPGDDSRYGDVPGLMAGLAGIGWFHLRLHHPSVPSVLLFRPDAWASLTAARPA